ncbi:MAG: hypothetical protein A3205_02225 [Methanomassiliicoccales archaeon Mx-03]|nr:MAG: hypothetical protein A3205_02225 [Methanomassiliicoccales archaeon Mx-03]
MNMNEKGRQTKLLAAIAIIAMVVCVFAAVMPSENVDGTTNATSDGTGAIITYTIGDGKPVSVNSGELTTFLDAVNGATEDVEITINQSFTVTPSGVEESEAALWFDNPNNVTITINGGDNTITFKGTNKTSVIGFYDGAEYSVSDLIIDGDYAASTNVSKHGINMVGADVTLDNITIKDCGAAGIVVNGGDNAEQSSTVSASNITTSGNAWGGINVDNDDGTANFTLSGSNDFGEQTQIWSESGNVSITGSENFVEYGWKKTNGKSLGAMWLEDGAMKVSGNSVTIADVIVVPAGATLTIPNKVTTITVDGSITVYEGGKFVYAEGATVTNDKVTDLNDSSVSVPTIDQNNLVIFAGSGEDLVVSRALTTVGNVSLSNGTTLEVSGALTVAKDTTFTVASGSTLVVNSLTATGAFTGTVTIVDSTSAQSLTLGADGDRLAQGDEFKGSITDTGVITITSGALTLVSGNFSFSGEIPVGATINVQKGVTLTLTADTTVNGTLNQYGRIVSDNSTTHKITVNDGGVFNAMSGATYENISVEGDGTINMGGAMNDATLTGVYSTSTTFALNQNMVVSGTLTVTGQATLYINGGLEIPEGTTVYIEEGSRIIVQGGVAEVVIAGTLNVYETGTFQVTGSKSVEISGTVISEESSTIDIAGPTELTGNASITAMGSFIADDGLEIGADATLNLQGAASINGTQNSGTIVFDGATVSTSRTTIQMTGNDAVVNIISVQLTNRGSLSVSDSALTVTNAIVDNDNTITFTIANQGNLAIEGVTITESFQTESRKGETHIVNSLAATGNMTVDRGEGTAALGNITFEGANVRVTETLNIDENIAVSVSGASTKLFVDGTMTMADGVVMTLWNGAQVTVNGQISSYDEIVVNAGAINAVYYRATAEPRNVYTNLADAVANNSASTTVVTLEVMGTVVVEEDVSIPAAIRMMGDGTLQIGTEKVRGIAVDFADGAEFRGTAIVYATMHFDNSRNDRGAITSDVVINNGSERTYTNVATAIAGAQPNDVITITGTDVRITSDLTIPEQVTLEIPLGSIVTVDDNVTVTVNGTIDTQTGLAAAHEFGERADDDTSRLVVNGTFMTTESGELSALYVKYNVAGAYYQLLTESGMYKFIQPVAVAAESDATAITIFGENTVGDVAFTGTVDERVVVTIAGASTATGAEYDEAELVAGTVTLSYATLDVDGKFDGTVATAEGSIEAVNVTGFVAVSSEINDEPVCLVNGTVSKFDNSENADRASFTVASGVVTVNDNTTLAVNSGVSFSISEGATLTVTGQSAVVRAGSVTVNGTLNAENGGAANVTTIYVLGTFAVGAADNSNGVVAGSSNVETLYIGINSRGTTTTGAAVNADTTLGSLTTIYLAAGNTVSEAQTNGKRTTAYNVQDELYMTVYTTSRTLAINGVETPELDGVYAAYWQYDKSGTMTKVAATDYVGDIPTVSAYIVEDVYLVTFTLEYGITDVYVDGELVATAGLSGNGNTNYVMLPAGEHTVTYRLDNGFSGTVTMTINGQAMTDGKFTLSADMPYLKDDVDYHGAIDFENPIVGNNTDFVVYNIVITGVEATGPVYPDTPSTGGSDSLGLTDYLLIILVILIVIMAIMVAMRLMRS